MARGSASAAASAPASSSAARGQNGAAGSGDGDSPTPLGLRVAKKVFASIVDNLVPLVGIPLFAVAGKRLKEAVDSGEIARAAERLSKTKVEADATDVAVVVLVAAFALAALARIFSTSRPTYLLDFYTYRPPDRMQTTHEEIRKGTRMSGRYNKASLDFMDKVVEISGLGDKTFLPDAVKAGVDKPVEVTLAAARVETEQALFTCIDHILRRTGLKPTDFDALIVNCTSFVPVPSLAAAVINHFKMRKDIRSFMISGMGCAATVIAIDMARDMLKSNPNMRILVANTENILWNMYFGNQRSMLITNCIFRLGGVAFVLTNKPTDRFRAKYVLKHLVRTHLASDDEAYNAVIMREDDEGIVGVKIGKELMRCAGRALENNITRLGPKVLPLSEQLIFAGNFIARKVFKMKHLKSYVPDFTTAFDHFCIHPGGKAVIDEVGKQLKLKPHQTLPMLLPFERYGNTSSSSTWYAWSYVETFQNVKAGDRIWQLAFGSGFKCCSAVWVSLRKNAEKHDAWTDTPSCE